MVLKQKNHLMHVCRCFTYCTKQNVAKIDTHHPDLYLGLGRLFTNKLNKAPQKSQSIIIIIIIGTNLNQSSSSKIKLDLLGERERERDSLQNLPDAAVREQQTLPELNNLALTMREMHQTAPATVLLLCCVKNSPSAAEAVQRRGKKKKAWNIKSRIRVFLE